MPMAAGTRNAGREFDYRLRRLQHALAGMTDEARVQVLETAHALALARRPGAGPELTEAAIALSQGAQDYADARAIQAMALVERNLASWMREATPARLEQASGSAIANAAQAKHLAARLRSRGDRLLQERREALEEERRNARRALEALELNRHRFDDEDLLDRLWAQTDEIATLEAVLSGGDGRVTEQDWARRQADLEHQVRVAQDVRRRLEPVLTQRLLPVLFEGQRLIELQRAVDQPGALDRVAEAVTELRADGAAETDELADTRKVVEQIGNADKQLDVAQQGLALMAEVDADPRRRGRQVRSDKIRAITEKRLALARTAQADLARQVRARPSTLRIARSRGLLAAGRGRDNPALD